MEDFEFRVKKFFVVSLPGVPSCLAISRKKYYHNSAARLVTTSRVTSRSSFS
jgi:hypothetical protein